MSVFPNAHPKGPEADDYLDDVVKDVKTYRNILKIIGLLQGGGVRTWNDAIKFLLESGGITSPEARDLEGKLRKLGKKWYDTNRNYSAAVMVKYKECICTWTGKGKWKDYEIGWFYISDEWWYDYPEALKLGIELGEKYEKRWKEINKKRLF